MSDRAKRDDQAKDRDADAAGRAAAPAQRIGDGDDDRLGALAKTQEELAPADRRRLADSTEVIKNGFMWLSDRAQQELERLRQDLAAQDEPPWLARLLEGIMPLALGAGAAAIGLHIANKLVPAGPVSNEFVKSLLEQGIGAGLSTAAGTLRNLQGAGNSGLVAAFIDAQRDGVWATQKANQTHFIKVKRHEIQTPEEAARLEAAFSTENLREAAREQYRASRDAWVSYLAQARFGAIGERGPVRPGDVSTGATRTNMSPQASRDRTNRGLLEDFVPADAPSLERAMLHDAPGVLTVSARLPFINPFTRQMEGSPRVEIALLNDVSGNLREQYEGRPLDTLRIPRHIEASVDGPMPNFEINVDEAGSPTYLDRERGAWARARASVGNSAHATSDPYEQQKVGLALLLQDLVPSDIRRRWP